MPTFTLPNGTPVPYTVERTARRRTRYGMAFREGEVVFSCPLKMPEETLIAFACKHPRWVMNRLKEHEGKATKKREESQMKGKLSPLPTEWWKKAAIKQLVPLTKAWANNTELTPQKVIITATKGRWGSCTKNGTVRLSCWLLWVPENLRNYVIIHELCHLKYMNHSPKFWKKVEEFYPDYKTDRKTLQSLGRQLL